MKETTATLAAAMQIVSANRHAWHKARQNTAIFTDLECFWSISI
ncbi:MAG TPA: hypothetical protein VF463_02850 [Sphingobium sp.]